MRQRRCAIRGLGPSAAYFFWHKRRAGRSNPGAARLQWGALALTNDNWRDTQEAEILAFGLAPPNELESAMIATLPSNASYTTILAGRSGGTGVGLVEIYDLDQAADSQLANISSRGLVQDR